MTICNLKDGSTVEIEMSGNGNAPDNQGGQHTNCSTVWFRFDQEPYRYAGSRSMHRTMQIAEISNNRSEFLELIENF